MKQLIFNLLLLASFLPANLYSAAAATTAEIQGAQTITHNPDEKLAKALYENSLSDLKQALRDGGRPRLVRVIMPIPDKSGGFGMAIWHTSTIGYAVRNCSKEIVMTLAPLENQKTLADAITIAYVAKKLHLLPFLAICMENKRSRKSIFYTES